MASAVIGAIAAITDNENALGKEFTAGLYSIDHIFIPVAGIMAAIPLLSAAISATLEPVFSAVNADPAMTATPRSSPWTWGAINWQHPWRNRQRDGLWHP